ncbi:zinc-dependent peptidase [Oceanicoccus sp. KOV_DT_Chl]|uniref:M90 family metallopeptidase n=1 Tax=Oceanicoccus sp. KOV_DT_Chl TaxID=1904639 RepID=UPI00190EAC78|nr:M90 family metallopeptidase [Oceanicoccus sp. KOV_DT_Chl]
MLIWYLLSRFKKTNKQKQRQQLFTAVITDHWRQILIDDFPLYQQLPAELKQKLEGHIQVFLSEKIFVGCDDMVITDQVRVLIAAQACILILNRPTDYFPGFETILVYPEVFQSPVTEREGHVESIKMSLRSGESWRRGPIVLAWSHVLKGAKNSADGYNVVMHEFAHKLDEQDATMDGTPVLKQSAQYRSWAQVFTQEYTALGKDIMRGHKHLIDDYAATSPAEFFAVVTETFFEKPLRLQKEHPELYQELSAFYAVDPLQWVKN